jgi:tetratricopeptide (TPR) repeat protein
MYELTNNKDEALEAYQRAWDLRQSQDYGWQCNFLSRIGRLQLELVSLEEALKTADELKALIDERKNQKLMRYHHILMSDVELKKKNYAAAIDLIQQAHNLAAAYKRWRPELGMATYQSGDLERARTVFEEILSEPGDISRDPQRFIMSYYMLGEIYEKMGSKDEAIKNFEKFLDYKKEADIGIEEVKEARRRLTKLNES